MSAFLDVKNLKKYFKTSGGILNAVDDVSFSVDSGKTLGVVGESGCGKSTLGRTIIGLLEATAGHVYFEGQDIVGVKGAKLRQLRTKMQIIFQDPFSSLDPRKSVSSLIAEPLIVNRVYSNRADREAYVRKLMDTVGLARRLASSFPHELDGGRRQRIGVARALAINPKFVVCDEPVSALDVSIQAQILNLLQDLQDEKRLTYLFITHDLSVVKHISDEIMVMYVGCTVEKCKAEQLFEHPLHPYTKGLLTAIPVANIHRERKRVILQGELTSPVDPKPGCRFAKRCVYAKDDCFNKQPVFQEVMPEHFVACHYVKEINELQ